MARLAVRAAVEAAAVTAEVVAISEFPALARRHRVTSVPRVDVDGRERLLGSQSEERFVDALFEAVAK